MQRRVEKEGKESWRFYEFGIFWLKWALEKDFEALRGAELMKMKCQSVWDTSRGLKPPKNAEKYDFARKKHFFLENIMISPNKRLAPN